MTAVINETDFELIETLDFEFAPLCEAVDGCDRTAAWGLVVKCCATTYLLCDGCAELVKEFEQPAGQVWTCGVCNNDVITPVVMRYNKL